MEVVSTSSPSGANVQQPSPKRRSSGCLIVAIIIGVVFVGFILLMAVFIGVFKGSFASKPVTIKPNTIVQLRISGTIEERSSSNPFSILGAKKQGDLTFFDVLQTLQRAKEDENIIGLYYRGGELRSGMAKAMELRDALKDFKTSGKFIYAFIETGNELDYLFASVADTIYMPTEGLLEMNGFAIEDIFWPDTFDKLGIKFHVDQFEEYKSAGESYTRKKFSPYAREALGDLLQQYYETLIRGIAQSRHLPPTFVRSALSRGIYTADSLLALGFIDRIQTESTVKERMLDNTKGATDSVQARKKKRHLVMLGQYSKSLATKAVKQEIIKDKQIALISATGIILPGEVENAPFVSEDVIASQTFIRYLKQAREDKRIKAIILRIDSPGDSVLAADAIWEEVIKTKKVKPIYASLSDVAASGGYYIAMACDSIIAHPETITGSIGVISTIPNFSGTLAKIGAHVDTVTTSPSALFFDPFLPFSERDKRLLRTYSASAYKRFVERVADSRSMTFEQARKVARGRVWTGEAALRHGLVDTLGGLQTALNLVKRRIGVAPDQKVRLRMFPPKPDPIDAFLKLFEQLSEQQSSHMHISKRNLAAMIPLWDLWPESFKKQFIYFWYLNQLGSRERILMAMPFLPIFK